MKVMYETPKFDLIKFDLEGKIMAGEGQFELDPFDEVDSGNDSSPVPVELEP